MRQILASLLCVIGISLLTLKGDVFSFGKGEFYSLMCAVFFAAHIIALDWGTKGENALAINALQMLTAGILSTACALFFDAPPRSVDMSAVLSALYLIAVSTCLAFLLQQPCAEIHERIQRFADPFDGIAVRLHLFVLALHEQITVMMIAGGALILASIVVVEYHPSSANISRNRQKRPGEERILTAGENMRAYVVNPSLYDFLRAHASILDEIAGLDPKGEWIVRMDAETLHTAASCYFGTSVHSAGDTRQAALGHAGGTVRTARA